MPFDSQVSAALPSISSARTLRPAGTTKENTSESVFTWCEPTTTTSRPLGAAVAVARVSFDSTSVASTAQVALQPSPPKVLASSHVSVPSTKPSPHSCTTWQVAEQPTVASHASYPSTTPLPQVAVTLTLTV